MAGNDRMREEFAYFGEAWNFFKKFYDVQDTDHYWDCVVQAAAEIMKRHDSPLCKAIVLAILDELEDKCREARKRSKDNT